MKRISVFFVTVFLFFACKKDSTPGQSNSGTFNQVKSTINDSLYSGGTFPNAKINPVIKISFSSSINKSTIAGNVNMTGGGLVIADNYSYENNDSTLIVTPASALGSLTSYSLTISTGLKSSTGASLANQVAVNFVTAIDSTDKFPQISDSALLTLVEQQTFKYFYDFGHPVSGMARERNSDGQT